MPIYEYACTACGHEFEEWQKMSDAPVRTCPKCRKKKVERLISRTAFQLKGGGWYADLYSSSKPGEAKESKAEAKSESSDSASTSGGSSGESAAKSSGDGGKSSSPGAGGKSSSKKKESSAKKTEPRAA